MCKFHYGSSTVWIAFSSESDKPGGESGLCSTSIDGVIAYKQYKEGGFRFYRYFATV